MFKLVDDKLQNRIRHITNEQVSLRVAHRQEIRIRGIRKKDSGYQEDSCHSKFSIALYFQ